jgi:hypothetical protein
MVSILCSFRLSLLLTARMLFIYFCLFDLLSMSVAYPSELIIKKEMKEDELMFVK